MSVIITITGGPGDIIINAGVEGKQGPQGVTGGLGDVLEVTEAYTTTNANTVIYFKGDFPVNLHSLSIATRVLTLKVALQGADTVTLIPDGSDLIEGAATYVMNSDEGLLLIPTSDGWEIL